MSYNDFNDRRPTPKAKEENQGDCNLRARFSCTYDLISDDKRARVIRLNVGHDAYGTRYTGYTPDTVAVICSKTWTR